MERKYKPKSTEELSALCDDKSIYLGDIDTSLITDMSGLFAESECTDFSGIETWDVSNVTDMRDMFAGAFNFNADISRWDVSKVEDMAYMFYWCEKFNQDISKWNTSNLILMSYMFCGARSFNQDISGWDTSKVTHMASLFENAEKFNQPIGNWNTANVKDIHGIFHGARAFNQDISGWKLPQPASEIYMFSQDCPIREEFKPGFRLQEIIIQRNIDGLAPATIRLTPDDAYALYNSLLTKFTVLDKARSGENISANVQFRK